jgi:hypothetical protein
VLTQEDRRRTKVEAMVIGSSAAALALVFLVSVVVFTGNWNAPNLDLLFSNLAGAIEDVG